MKELVEIIAKALVDSPDEVVVTETENERDIVIILHVADSDMGKVIGKQGRIVVLDNEIRVMCSETDVFRCMVDLDIKYLLRF